MNKRQQKTLTNFFSPVGTKTSRKSESSSPAPSNKTILKPIVCGTDKEGNFVQTVDNTADDVSESSQPLAEIVNMDNTPAKKLNNSNRQDSDRNGSADDEQTESPVKQSAIKKYKRLRIDDSDEDDDGSSQNSHSSAPKTPVLKSRKLQQSLGADSPSQLLSPFSFSNLTPSTPSSPASSRGQKSKSKTTDADNSVPGNEKFKHLAFKFLHLSQIKDKNMRSVDHSDYDPTTLHVPSEFLREQTPGHQQWWMFKANYFDTILFFKVGKFYELYHMDAVTAVEELGLTFMRGDYAHCGFPEIGFDKFSDILVQKGYKIARVEQTETPDEMESRVAKMRKTGKKVNKYDRVVAREVCQVTTKATQLPCPVNSQSSCETSENHFLLAVVERDSDFNTSKYGMCYVDTKIGTIHFSQFKDDRFSSVLRVFFSHLCPVEIVHQKGQLSQRTLNIIKSLLPSAKLLALKNDSQFYSSGKTLKKLQENKYFESEQLWPEFLGKATNEEYALCDKVDPEFELAVHAFGGIIYKLQECMIDHDVISLGDFQFVNPSLANIISKKGDLGGGKSPKLFDESAKMILDSSTISNLGILDNFGKSAFTLLQTLDTCITPFGKRLLKQFLCSPPCNPNVISKRQEAVVWLMENREFVEKVKTSLRKVPDLEHLLTRIHSLGVDRKAINHPDSRANFFEANTYKKRNVQDFVTILNTLKKCIEVSRIFQKCTCDSTLLIGLLSCKSEGGHFPTEVDEFIEKFQTAFDPNEACLTGEIQPKPGLVQAFDSSLDELARIKADSEKYLREQRRLFRCDRIQYSTGKLCQFQLEIPSDEVSRVPDNYNFASKRKGWDRFHSSETQSFLNRWTVAENNREECLKDVARIVFNDFSKEFSKCSTVVRSIATLDVLIALAEFSRSADPVMCRPKILNCWDSFLDIRNGKHPCMEHVIKGGYIPNNMQLGRCPESETYPPSANKKCPLVLLTGPNMGGKSTLMRQTGLLVVLAQLGCFVPAEQMTLTPVDRIFTRLGAMDRILCGESTFFVEMSETCVVLNYATRHSLVLLDELGRGTSTFDGTAIALAVVDKLANEFECRTLFSTHYHWLVSHFKNNPNVFLGHMACMEESEDDPENEATEQKVTFLYRFARGACPKSYGFNAARMAGIDGKITRDAHHYSTLLETMFHERVQFMQIAKLVNNRL